MASAPAKAAVVFQGYTNGCFDCVAPPNTSAVQTASLLGLSYTNSTFNVVEAGGIASIGTAPGVPNLNNLGSFTLTGAPAVYTGNTFDLRVTFTAPPGTSPATSVFTADLLGTVTSTDVGGVYIDFDNTAHHYTFTNGSFNFFVNDLSITPGGNIALSGTIRDVVAGVPEPSTWAMMVLGFAGVGFMAYRRKSTFRLV
jgi:hypothetical protein